MASVPQTPEPLPPKGLNAGKLHDVIVAGVDGIGGPGSGETFFQWLAVDHPTWSRQQAEDLEALKTWCAANAPK